MAHSHYGEDFEGHANENNIFTLGRSEGFPSQYPEVKTAVTEDVIEVALVYVFVTVGLSFTIILLPACGEKARVFMLVRVVVGLFVGAILMTSIYGQLWEVGKTKGTVPYKAGKPDEIYAEIGIRIGLKSVNITLRAEKPSGNLAHEKINYNERFSWTWDQGRIGFGPYAGRLQQEFRAAQRRGLPLPILWLAEYFTIDGEGFRFGRKFRTAGWYAYVSLWAAVPSWILANLLFTTVVRYGAIWASVTGLLQLLACLLWSQIKNPIPLEIPFNEGELTTKYGHCFWLTFSSGIVCVIIGLTVILADLRFPDEVSVFFGRDPLSEYEECHLDPQEVDLMRTKAAKKWEELIRQRKREEMMQMQASDEIAFDMAEMSRSSFDQPAGVNTLSPGAIPPLQPSELVLKRGSTVRRVQKSLIRTPAPVAPTNIPFYLPTYEEEY